MLGCGGGGWNGDAVMREEGVWKEEWEVGLPDPGLEEERGRGGRQ